MPLAPSFNGNFSFSSATDGLAASPVAYSSGFDLGPSASDAQVASAGVDVTSEAALQKLLDELGSTAAVNQTDVDASLLAPGGSFDPFAGFDLGMLGFPMGPSHTSLLGSVPGLTDDHAKVANAHAEYGSLPRLVRKTSYDEAMANSAMASHGQQGQGKAKGSPNRPGRTLTDQVRTLARRASEERSRFDDSRGRGRLRHRQRGRRHRRAPARSCRTLRSTRHRRTGRCRRCLEAPRPSTSPTPTR